MSQMKTGLPESAYKRRFDEETLAVQARTARLELDEERLRVVAPLVEEVYAMFDMLDDVDLGETFPVTSFSVR